MYIECLQAGILNFGNKIGLRQIGQFLLFGFTAQSTAGHIRSCNVRFADPMRTANN
jgi:hypothetical protein